MSPRKPAVLRDGDGQNLRDHLIATAARLIGERGTAGLGVREGAVVLLLGPLGIAAGQAVTLSLMWFSVVVVVYRS